MLKCEFQRAFHTFVHFFSHQFTENEPFSSYTRHNTDVFLLIHPLNITQARAAVLPETKGGCRHAKSTNSKLSFRPVGFSPRPLCAWSWSVPFLQLGHNVGGYSSGHLVNTRGGGKSIRTTVTTPSTISDRTAKKSEQENRSRKKNASIGNNGLIKHCEAQKCNRIANKS